MVRDTLDLHEDVEEMLQTLLIRVWVNPFTSRSDFSRENAEIVGFAAEKRLITLLDFYGSLTPVWRITSRGAQLLEEYQLDQN